MASGGDTVKDRIEFVIKSANIKKVDFAKRLNLSQAFVSQMCSGVANPSDRTIIDICQEFGVNEPWLRTGEGEPFRELSKEEEIMRFAVRINKGSDEFRKAYVAMLANLSDEGWAGLQEMYTQLSEIYKKE
jgi:transcriptional regulator with XRE-family HTH domain